MFFKQKKVMLLTLAIMVSMILAACGSEGASGEGTYNWTFVTEEMEGQVQYEYAREFADRLHEKSDGDINIEVFEFGGLGDEVNQVEQLQSGIVEFAIVSPGFTGTMVDEGQLFALQFLFTDDMELNQHILDTSEALNVHLANKYEQHNIKPLAFWTEGAMQWTGNRELRTPEDFNGFKMRTQESPLIVRSYQAYGADPTPMSWGELYTSLDRGVVDGQENPIFFIEDASFHEVQSHMTISRHNIYVAMTTVNPDFYNGLPEDIRNMIDETVEEMRPVGFELQAQLNEELLDSIIDSETHPTEVIELTEAERDAFRALAEPVREYFVNEVVDEDGKMILEMLQSEIEAAQ
ncbi:DctP family TRAP transporter solute-binding subunit [Alkalihalobacterium chitinilyticum]|uniref:DctP family TRAP transporter solute-binding subunit n=1 Tax=Alkalihalobacterium chitinilyticum TaxID=2980103 RepID=A0ABT5VIS0_9BACI|nr:DctP family TRAP transporter solute-binding subunit [Alkalihalobacterium chitinilyticum]MDE5415357.1 DctP family TRAP transporter solute-binding subunit [Alkalihalobacterium chitinilyticum]